MPADWSPDELPRAIGLLDAWLDSMRAPDGYSGPVSHWWDSCLVYTGAMFDWRYEGIVCGYLNLYRIGRETHWLEKARRAADDLVCAQLDDGHFRNSSFEHGPQSGGTPHEAAADIALLELARVLKESDDPSWQVYFDAAGRNLQVQMASLWNGHGFTDQPHAPALVANKNATLLEALLLYQQLGASGLKAYIKSAARVALSAQISNGATVHRGTFGYRLSFGIYTARCVGAFCRLMNVDPRPQYLDFIARAVPYLVSLVRADGSCLGHNANARLIAAPLWIAPSGDLLRALLEAQSWVNVPENAIQTLVGVLVRAQTPCGGIPTSRGLNARGAARPHLNLPDFRDVLPVVGWCDKAFRALSMIAASVESVAPAPVETACSWRKRPCVYYEDDREIGLLDRQGKPLYEWRKGAAYPSVVNLWT